jgi:hypothetical protein
LYLDLRGQANPSAFPANKIHVFLRLPVSRYRHTLKNRREVIMMRATLDWSDLEVEAVEVANLSTLGVEMLVGPDGLAVGLGTTEVGTSCTCCLPNTSCSCGPPGCCNTCCPGCAPAANLPEEDSEEASAYATHEKPGDHGDEVS